MFYHQLFIFVKKFFGTNDSQIKNFNQIQPFSITTVDNSTELTDEMITPTEIITSSSSLPQLSQTITNSAALIPDARQKQIVFLPQTSSSKKMQQMLTENNLIL